jgi:protease-4
MVLVGMMASFGSAFGNTAAVVTDGSVLRLNPGTITDSPSSSIMDGFDFATMTQKSHTSLLGAVQAIQAAAHDDRIKGIYINFDENTAMSLSSFEELRTELVKFKESGKFVVAYVEYWAQAGYWFASVADKIYTNPSGGLQWTGMSMQVMFFKGLLDKLDIKPVVVRHGQFKSAVEPFILDKMSSENRLQYEKLAGSMWNVVVDGVSSSRGIAETELQKLADDLTIDSPEAAVENGMIDGLRYEDEVLNELGHMAAGGWSREAGPVDSLYTETVGGGVKIVEFSDYVSQLIQPKATSQNKIAVIYAEGDIVSGKGSQGQMGSESMVKKIEKAREDKGVKAVVFRINSPGGSALASEVIRHELELLKAEKPLIVSMGSYAASGGYWIATPADAIYADRSTLTGSIGVFGLFANMGDAMRNKLGVTTDVVRTNKYSDIGTPFRAPSSAELAYFQKSVERTYSMFADLVAEGRNMTFEAVDNIGQGRVWSGADALEIGLIDGFGGLIDAIALAADRVGVTEDFRIYEVMDELSPFDAFMSGFSAKVRSSVLRDEMGRAFTEYESLRNMIETNEVQARLPYILNIQ